jgi:hypothetical protein
MCIDKAINETPGDAIALREALKECSHKLKKLPTREAIGEKRERDPTQHG